MSFILRVLSKTQSVLGFILDLRFLPDKFQQWIFGTCTRAIEMLNSAVMLGFALVFQHIPPNLMVIVLTGTALLQLYAAIYQSNKSNIWSGWLLIWSALVWSVIAGTFWAAYPPLSTGMFTYLIFAFFCGLAGFSLIRYTKKLEDQKKLKRRR